LSEAGTGQKYKTLSKKITKAKKGWGETQVVEHLPRKLKTSLNPSTAKGKEGKKKKHREKIGGGVNLGN
jgi:hypothetical protein